MRIEVLGSVRLRTDQGDLVDVAERKVRLLLAALVAAGGEVVSADALIERAWGHRLPSNPPKVLRAKLSQLRSALDTAEPGARDLLQHTPAGYRLAVGTAAVDARRFLRDVEDARAHSSSQGKAEALRRALRLWQGDPYSDFAEEIWLAPAIAELCAARADAVELFIETLVQHGFPEQAIEQVSGALDTYLTRERLIAALMLALYQVGRQHEALELFESLRHRLAEDLGADPSPQVRELHARILRQDPTLRTATPPADSQRATPGRTNLPAETSEHIGREQETNDIDALVEQSRLVTLTGVGGVGKTRLALHIARRQAPRFNRGTWFLDLTELSATVDESRYTSSRVASLATAALSLPETGIFSHLECIGDALSARPALLVLDNCEHVVTEAAAFVVELWLESPDIRVLATSREPLGVHDEQRYDVDTLATDGGDSEAVDFFATKARATDPTFKVDESNATTVAELCRRLDGLPLALELAASRIRGVSLTDLMDRLSERLNLLRRPGRAVPRRQQTLRGMIDWSWSLLDDAEIAVLRRLAVHPGTLSLDAAEAICADDEVAAADVVDVLIRLVDRSLVTTTRTSTEVRYGLLESIAAYAAEKLRPERDAVAQRHLDYYRALATSIDAGLRSRQQRTWLTRLEAERAQLRHAFEEAVATADGDVAVELTLAGFGYQLCVPGSSIGPSISEDYPQLLQDFRAAIKLPGHRDDNYAAVVTLEACLAADTAADKAEAPIALALSRFSGDKAAKARVQWFAGTTLLAAGVRDTGEHLIDTAMDVLHREGEDWYLAIAACRRDWLMVTLWREPARGLPDGRDVREVLRQVDDGFGVTHALALEHRQAEAIGDHAESAKAVARALELSRELRLWSEVALWVTCQGIEAIRDGELNRARQCLDQARALAADKGFAVGLAFTDFAAAMIARLEGDTRRARDLLDNWLYFGDAAKADILTGFEEGFLSVAEGDIARAETALRGLLIPQWDAVESRIMARTLEFAAAIRTERGEPRAAAELLGAAQAVRDRVGAAASAPERFDGDRLRELLAAQLTAELWDQALARGYETTCPGELL